MGLGEKNWSEGVVKLMVWLRPRGLKPEGLSGMVGFATVEGILGRVGQIGASDSSIWRRVQERGERFQALEAREGVRAIALSGQWGRPLRGLAPKGRIGVAMDGGMVHIRGEG